MLNRPLTIRQVHFLPKVVLAPLNFQLIVFPSANIQMVNQEWFSVEKLPLEARHLNTFIFGA